MKIFHRIGMFLFFFSQAVLCVFAQYGTITTYVGPILPVNGARANTLTIDFPSGIAADGSGGFYVSSSTQQKIYRVSADGIISVIAGGGARNDRDDGGPATATQLSHPKDIAVDSAGNIHFVEMSRNRIRKVTPAGIINTVAGGNFTRSYGGDGGPAITAMLNSPSSVAVDAAGNLYIGDMDNGRIRKISAAGIISTVAGNGAKGDSGDGGQAIAAQINVPAGLAVDSEGNLYIADSKSNRIRKVTPAGIIYTAAGTGQKGYNGDGGSAATAQLNSPFGVAVDSSGNLYIADYGNNRIRKVTNEGVICTIAGNGNGGYDADEGPAIAATLNSPAGVAVDSAGNVFIMDAGNNRIRKVTKKGIISTMLGRGIKGYSGDGGPATAAQLNSPDSIAMDTAGNLYIADMLNHRIRKVTPTGIISTVAGTGIEGCCGDGGQATDAQLHFPYGVAVDSTGSIYIADTNNDRIRKVTRAGIIGTVAGIYGGDGNGEGELAVTTKLNRPEAVAVDSAYNLYIADTGNNRILKVTPENGKIRIVAGNGQKGYSGDGGPATAAQLDHPKGMAIDAEGNLYIADMINNRIRKVTTAGIISTIAGNGASGCRTISAGVRATAECLPWPSGVAFDSGGNLYIAALSGNQVLKLTPAGIISAISGNGFQGFTGDGGPASAAQLYGAASVALDSAGNIYVADRDNHRVRKIIKQ